MVRMVSLVFACLLWVSSAAGEPSRPLVGHVMALLAVFEEAAVLPPETSPEANALIHALIQTQAALIKSTNPATRDRKSTRLNSSHLVISYAVFCLKKKKQTHKHKTHKV